MHKKYTSTHTHTHGNTQQKHTHTEGENTVHSEPLAADALIFGLSCSVQVLHSELCVLRNKISNALTCRSVGVSNFGIQHLEGIKNSGRPLPSVNQVRLRYPRGFC